MEESKTGNRKIIDAGPWRIEYSFLFRSKSREKKLHERNILRENMRDSAQYVKPVSEFTDLDSEYVKAFQRYYEYARKEIDREDGITFSRLTLTLSFQAFLIGATVFLFSGIASFVPKNLENNRNITQSISIELSWMFILFGVLFLVLISVVGFVISHFSYLGIKESRTSLRWAKDMWIDFNEKNGRLYPSLFPQLTKYAALRDKDRHRLDGGTEFALIIPTMMRLFWLLTFLIWMAVLIELLRFPERMPQLFSPLASI